MEARMRSNDSIAQLACALAKAKIELVNPPKSQTAHLDGDGNGSPSQSYRYAPLSAGLDIVRKTLGKHEIAVLQTTDMDRESGLVVLTTTLAHGSGECRGALAGVPHRRSPRAQAHGGCAHLRPAIRPVHAGRARRRG